MKFPTSNTKKKERGVVSIIGLVLILGMVVAALGVYQTTTVPTNQKTEEKKHVNNVVSDMRGFVDGVSASETGKTSTVTVSLGFSYGTFSTVPFPNPANELRVNKIQPNISIKNAVNTGLASDFWNGTTKTYETSILEYRTNYFRFDRAPNIYYEYGLAYKDYRDWGRNEIIPINDQNLISGNQINLNTLAGDFSTSQSDTVSVNISPVSAGGGALPIQNESDRPIRIEIPTRLNATHWETILDSQDSEFINNVVETGYSSGYNMVQIELNPEKDYQMTLSKSQITTQDSITTQKSLSAKYAAWAGEDDVIIREGSRREVQAIARDKMNNPVPGVELTANLTGDVSKDDLSFIKTNEMQSTKETDSTGRTMFGLKASESITGTLSFNLDVSVNKTTSN